MFEIVLSLLLSHHYITIFIISSSSGSRGCSSSSRRSSNSSRSSSLGPTREAVDVTINPMLHRDPMRHQDRLWSVWLLCMCYSCSCWIYQLVNFWVQMDPDRTSIGIVWVVCGYIDEGILIRKATYNPHRTNIGLVWAVCGVFLIMISLSGTPHTARTGQYWSCVGGVWRYW